MPEQPTLPYLGFGLGLRSCHYDDILSTKPALDWFEILTENYLVPGGKPLHYLDNIRTHYPMVMHGVSLSLGSTEPLDKTYLKKVQQLAKRIEPEWISDHLCWTGTEGLNMHDLLPLPYTKEVVTHVVARIDEVQNYLKRPILIENVSSYLSYQHSEMSEWEFILTIARQSGAYILLDVNNIYVSSVNHGFHALDYVKAMPKDKIAQIHLAGHSKQGDYIIDTHDAPIIQEVWDLYRHAILHLGPISTMIERDDNIPPLTTLLDELAIAKEIVAHANLEALTE